VGAISQEVDLAVDLWKRAIRERIPERFLSANLRAFELGRGQRLDQLVAVQWPVGEAPKERAPLIHPGFLWSRL